MRSQQLQARDMLAATELLVHAVHAVLGSLAALSNAAAVAGLASALTSLVKRAVQFNRTAANMQEQPEAEHTAAAYFPRAVAQIVVLLLTESSVDYRLFAAAITSNGSSSIQMRASAALLAVVLLRSLVQLAEAMEAAGPRLMCESLTAGPLFIVRWAPSLDGHTVTRRLGGSSIGQDSRNAEGQKWLEWQRIVVAAAHGVWDIFTLLGLAPTAAAAAAAGGKGAAAHTSSGAASSSSSSSSIQHVQWSYLLNLQQLNPEWAAAAAQYVAVTQTYVQHVRGVDSGMNIDEAHFPAAQVAQRYCLSYQL
jgi:hypothetical protein